MSFVYAPSGQVHTYPVTRTVLKELFPLTLFPADLNPAAVAELDLFPVAESTQPDIDSATEYLEEANPALVDGVWTQQWELVARTPEEQAAYAQNLTDMAARVAIKTDASVKTLLRVSPEQINNYIDANVTDMVSAKEVLKILARAVAVVAQTTLKN